MKNVSQYLFNAPEGFSRLVLEHKIRPTAALKAVFSLKPWALVSQLNVCHTLHDLLAAATTYRVLLGLWCKLLSGRESQKAACRAALLEC